MATKKETKKGNGKTVSKNTKTNRNTKSATSTRQEVASNGKKQIQSNDDRSMKIIAGLIFIVLGVFLFAAVEFQAAGQFGNIIGEYLKGTMGHIGIVFPFFLIIAGILMIADKTVKFNTFSFAIGVVILLMLCIANSGRFIDPQKIVFNPKDFFEKGVELKSGGLFGMGLGSFLVKYLGKIGLYCISIGVAILATFILLKDTPAKKLINQIRIKNQERKIAKSEYKQELEKEKEERKLEEERIRENKRRINEIKEDQKRRRQETKEKNAKEINGETKKGFLDNVHIVPLGHDALDEYDSTKFDKGIPFDERTERIVSAVNNELNPEPDTSEFNFERDLNSSRLGIEPIRVAKRGFGLGEEDYDSRSDGIITKKTSGNSEKNKPATGKQDLTNTAEEQVKINPFLDNTSKDNRVKSSVKSDKTQDDISGNKLEKITNKEAENAVLNESDFNKVKRTKKYKYPTPDLLKYVRSETDLTKTNSELKDKAELLERTLNSFNVDAKVIQVTQGPAVTRYEIQPNVGVKVNKIVSLADDIALNLRARSIRIEAPIPGKAAVGIEVENDNVNMVTIRELIDSKEFKKAESKIAFGVGRDIAGKAIVADLKSMPHLLIAGSTGSGKSVCINSIITSILYKANPDEVKFVLIDPKVVELGDYNGIPHLLIPVVTEATKAAAALNWAVAEMTNRYKLFADNHVRDLKSYNEQLKARGEEILPQIVIIIDELADLMMAAPSQVEESITRLAQLARAAGMHLIVATQRPSVDVITGVIKANIPSRIAFAVASQFDSRTILDMGGAEKLVGKGDMLYNPLGMGKPIRVQGCFISDEEIHRVIDFVKNQQDAEYSDEVMETINRGNVQGGSDYKDELFDEAVEYVIGAGKASTSLIQRRFRIGYNRAANIIDEMEARGIIGPAEGSKPRQVLATSYNEEPDYTEDEAVDASDTASDIDSYEEEESPDSNVNNPSSRYTEEIYDAKNSKMIQDLWDDMDNK